MWRFLNNRSPGGNLILGSTSTPPFDFSQIPADIRACLDEYPCKARVLRIAQAFEAFITRKPYRHQKLIAWDRVEPNHAVDYANWRARVPLFHCRDVVSEQLVEDLRAEVSNMDAALREGLASPRRVFSFIN